MLLSLLPYLIHSTTGGALPAVVAGVVVAFLLLTLLIAGIIVGVVMLGRAKTRKNSPEKTGKLVEKIECAEKQEESPESEPTAGDNIEWQTDEAAFQDEQHVEGLYYESTDVLGLGPLGREEGNRIRFEGGHYDDIGAVLPKDGAAHWKKGNTQQDDQSKGTPNVVYAVVDKSKKKRKEKTQGGASATTTQRVCTEEQHYEWSSVFGQDWFGNVVGWKPEDIHGDVEQGSPSNDANGTGPQSEPYNPNANDRQEQEKEQNKTE